MEQQAWKNADLKSADQVDYALGQDEEFKNSYNLKSSDTDKYIREDIFDEQLTATAKRILLETRIQQIWRISFPIFVAVLTIISVVLYFLDRGAPIYDGSTDTALELIVFTLSFFGLSERFTDNNFAFIAVAFPLIGFLNQLSLSREVRKRSKTYLQVLDYIKDSVRHAKQIFIGSGSISFSYGNDGFYVNGKNIEMIVDWRATFFADEVKKTSKRDPSNHLGRDIIEPSDVSEATHLIIFLKPGIEISPQELGKQGGDLEDEMPSTEFIVVPKARFFGAGRNATPWEEFVEGIHAHIQRAN